MTKKNQSNDPHLVIIGGGSAAFSAAIAGSDLEARVTIINDGLPIGGTCVNVGCVPSKTLIRAAEAVHRAQRHGFAGVETSGRVTDFQQVIEQKRVLVEELRQAKYLDVVADMPGFSRIEGRARLLSPTQVQVGDRRLDADKIIIATGVRPTVPETPGMDEVEYLNNESAFELDALPSSMIVVGGSYVGLEIAQMFARFGTRVTVLARRHVLRRELADVRDGLVGFLREEGIRVEENAKVASVRQDGEGVVASVSQGDKTFEVRAEKLLMATGRAPNTTDMGLEDAGVRTDRGGFIEVDDHMRTSVPGIWAAGDVIGGEMFVYTAADGGALAARNAVGPGDQQRRTDPTPWVVFTDPQVAGIGLDEQQAADAGIDAEAATLPLSHVPRALAARDTRGFIKLVRDRKTDLLVGARILAPEGSELLMELSVAMRAGLTVAELRNLLHPYLTLGEGIKLAAITFGKDVAKLSCCAS